ncbi:hypothetical protein NDU88_002466 [Pleurodeles waltl]|uniref:Uncharacterized protein n=1 Tax=Pleurodeles waltl TaxID=8319 RepID=A0AAV7T2D9_PLEWA|nr:hypothetical protein NDU88_002466 [Pleurodeles waltl]
MFNSLSWQEDQALSTPFRGSLPYLVKKRAAELNEACRKDANSPQRAVEKHCYRSEKTRLMKRVASHGNSPQRVAESWKRAEGNDHSK